MVGVASCRGRTPRRGGPTPGSPGGVGFPRRAVFLAHRSRVGSFGEDRFAASQHHAIKVKRKVSRPCKSWRMVAPMNNENMIGTHPSHGQMVGVCLQCKTPVFGPRCIAFPDGPVHIVCHERSIRRKSASPAVWFAFMIPVLFVLGILFIISANVKPKAPSRALSNGPKPGDDMIVWKEAEPYWHPVICPKMTGWEAYLRVGDGDAFNTLELHGCFTVKPKTRVYVLSDAPEVRIVDGPKAGKQGFTSRYWLH